MVRFFFFSVYKGDLHLHAPPLYGLLIFFFLSYHGRSVIIVMPTYKYGLATVQPTSCIET